MVKVKFEKPAKQEKALTKEDILELIRSGKTSDKKPIDWDIIMLLIMFILTIAMIFINIPASITFALLYIGVSLYAVSKKSTCADVEKKA